MTAPSVSIIMPALNEEENIQAAIEDSLAAMDAHGITGELVVVNDGSTDGTELIVKKCIEYDSRIRLIHHKQTLGIGKSFWDGVHVSRCEAVVMLPSDNENYPDEILRYIDMLNHVDMVVPFVFSKGKRSFFRRILSKIYTFSINIVFGVHFRYTNGTVLYRKSILEDVRPQAFGFFYQTEILVVLSKRGYLFVEVPYRVRGREKGESKALSLRSVVQVLRNGISLFRSVYLGNATSPEQYVAGSVTKIRKGQQHGG